MDKEQSWIPSAVKALDNALKNSNIGNTKMLKNKYYVVLFGNAENYGGLDFRQNRSSVVKVDGKAKMTASKVEKAMAKFRRKGNAEDGYEAIEHALKIGDLRKHNKDVALNLALITDEPRDPFRNTDGGTNSSLDDIRKELIKRKATLNLLGKFNFESNAVDNQDIVAVDFQGHIHGLDGKTVETGGFQNSSINISLTPAHDSEMDESCRAFVEYAPLAMSTGGAVWDLGIIKGTEKNSKNREAFTKILAEIKAGEVLRQSVCAECKVTCEGPERKPNETCNPEVDQIYCRCRASGKSDEECERQIKEGNDLQTAQYDFSSLYSTCAARGFPAKYEGRCDKNWPFDKKFNGGLCGMKDSVDAFTVPTPPPPPPLSPWFDCSCESILLLSVLQ